MKLESIGIALINVLALQVLIILVLVTLPGGPLPWLNIFFICLGLSPITALIAIGTVLEQEAKISLRSEIL